MVKGVNTELHIFPVSIEILRALPFSLHVCLTYIDPNSNFS